ncbi:MAG: hypothetical protein PVH29_06060 [Candidatus Zixiibacteriota bacterium]|jgi:hypothetical protein
MAKTKGEGKKKGAENPTRERGNAYSRWGLLNPTKVTFDFTKFRKDAPPFPRVVVEYELVNVGGAEHTNRKVTADFLDAVERAVDLLRKGMGLDS